MLPERADVLIVGGGPAGLAAALELRRQGVRDVVVADREPEVGGTPRLCHHTGFGLRDLQRALSGPAYAARYARRAREVDVALHAAATITGWQGDRTLDFTCPDGIGRIEARAILLATGCRERPRAARLVPGSRPQGIFTTGSLQRCVYEQGLPVGRRAVIVGAELVSLSALMTLRHAHVSVVAMATELPFHQIYLPYLPMKWLLADGWNRVPILSRARVSDIVGRRRVEGVAITHLESGRTEPISCDTVVFTGDWIPENDIVRGAGLSLDRGTRGPQVDAEFRTDRRGVFAAGNLLRGAETADLCALEGRRAAGQIAAFLRDESWPEPALPVSVEPPLAWICPNRIRPGERPPGNAFAFRSREFVENADVQICQGDRRLGSWRFRRLVVNETLYLPTGRVEGIDPAGPPLHLSVV